MSFGECKVYNDGSHYIAIPYVPNPRKKKWKPPEEMIVVKEEGVSATEIIQTDNAENPIETHEITENEVVPFGEPENTDKPQDVSVKKAKKERKMTRKELFEELYQKHINVKKSKRKEIIIEQMLPYFKDRETTYLYVTAQFERKQRNIICRRVRMTRKINLAEFNYFCTFTYDDKKHTEDTFKNKLRGCFKMLCHRKGWKYAGVWERAPESNRLHFHGLFYIPDGTMPGELKEKRDYNTKKHRMQTTYQNTYFNDRFGRSDFEEVDSKAMLGESIAYLTKYMEKTGEKIVYSKGLPQYFISDIMDEDIVCTIGQEDKKLLLFDDFTCWDEGCYIGPVSPEVIQQMRKAN